MLAGEDGELPRVKPFKYTYQKEIVMYAYFKKLDYFSTECIYAPFAARGLARDFVKDLEVITILVLEIVVPCLFTLSLAQCMECLIKSMQSDLLVAEGCSCCIRCLRENNSWQLNQQSTMAFMLVKVRAKCTLHVHGCLTLG